MWTAQPSWPQQALPWAGRGSPRDEYVHCSTELGGDPEQRQELPSMDYPHSSALPSPPWPGIPLPKQGVLYSILTALCTHPSTLLLDGSLHCGLMDITPGTGQAWLSQCTDSMAPTDALEMVYG